MSRDGIGKAKYGATGGWKNHEFKTDKAGGTMTYHYRIGPPIKSCAATGEWAKYYGLHYGDNGVNDRDPAKTVPRPYLCIQKDDYKTKMVLRECPKCTVYEQKKLECDQLKITLQDPARASDALRSLFKEQQAWLFAHNCDRKWNMWAMDHSGQWGLLKISHTLKKVLEAKIKKLQQDESIDATDPDQGVFWRFTRTGTGINVQDEIEVEQEVVKDQASGRSFKATKPAPLTDAQVDALLACPDLNDVVKVLSEDQIRLIANGSGDPSFVDEVWAMGTMGPALATKPTAQDRVQQRYDTQLEKAQTPPPPQTPPQPPPAPTAAPVPPTDPMAMFRAMGLSEDQVRAVMGMASALKPEAAPSEPVAQPVPVAAPEAAKPEPAPVAPVPATPAAAPPSNPPAGLSNDQFWAMFKKQGA